MIDPFYRHPWYAENGNVYEAGGKIVATAARSRSPFPPTRRDANMHLIAAMPRMLMLLHAIRDGDMTEGVARATAHDILFRLDRDINGGK